MRTGFATLTFEDLIIAALMGQLHHHGRFWDEAYRYARKVSLGRAPGLPEDLHDEVASEAIRQLLEGGAGGLETHSGLQLFGKAVIHAIRKVKADNAAPGERTRPSGKAEFGKVAAEHADKIVRVAEGGAARAEFNLAAVRDPAGERAIEELEARIDLARVMRTAPPSVASALRLIHIENNPAQVVAALQGVNRVTLYRRIENFCAPWRLAA